MYIPFSIFLRFLSEPLLEPLKENNKCTVSQDSALYFTPEAMDILMVDEDVESHAQYPSIRQRYTKHMICQINNVVIILGM
jgi:hypothetical protein